MKFEYKLFFIVMSIALSTDARYHTINKDRMFDTLINQYEYAVVCFAPSRAEDKQADRDEKKEIVQEFNSLKHRLKSASDSDSFKKYLQKEVGFLLIDTASGSVQELDDQFDLEKIPACLLFKQGKAILTGKNHYAQLFEPKSKYSIVSFLKRYFGDDFDDIVDDKKEEEKLDRQERIASYQMYPYSYGYPYAYGYPYYGYGAWGYPYYRSYPYRGYVSFGVVV